MCFTWGGDYWNLRNHVRLKIRSIELVEGKYCKYVGSVIVLEICSPHDYMLNRVVKTTFILVITRREK